MSDEKKILVTQPALPELDEFLPMLREIWDSKWLTNKGKFHEEFEAQLQEYLGVKHVSLFANGTLALVTALQTLNITGDVLTTPYSFVATSNSLWWNKIQPVFTDIEPKFCTIDPQQLSSSITGKTTALLPVHVYGNPCDVHAIDKFASEHGLKVIYDAAHAFGNEVNGEPMANFGDLSILSFHATKPFNTMEGGAIICHDAETKQRIDYLKNFGFKDETTVVAPGINSKMNEMQAALGLLQLKHHRENIAKRKEIALLYREGLADLTGIRMLNPHPQVTNYNYAYFPIFVENDASVDRDALYFYLQENKIFGRRYFYPLISEFPTYVDLPSAQKENLSTAYRVSREVICLPIYPDLDHEDVHRIIDLIKKKLTA